MTKSSYGRQQRRNKPISRKASFTLEFMKSNPQRTKQPSVIPQVPEAYCGSIGKIAVTWSLVELQVDTLINAFLKHLDEAGPEGWDRRNFRKRKELCRDLSKKALADAPHAQALLADVLGAAADLHWRRNFVLHGRLSVDIIIGTKPLSANNVEIVSRLTATSRHNGKEKTLVFDEEGMADLFHEISHVAGKFNAFMKIDAGFAALPSHDKEQLEALLRHSLPTPPTL